jgi:hypothetical protein
MKMDEKDSIMNVQYRISKANATKWQNNLAQWQRPGDTKRKQNSALKGQHKKK